MKKNFSFVALAIAIVAFASTLLPSCSSFEEEGTGYPLRLGAIIENASGLPDNVLTKESPCRVIAYSREKACSPYYFLFEDTAYISGNGELNWIGKYRYWPGVYTKFIAYWPADAQVVLDESGVVVSADCVLIAKSEPLCHFSENPILSFSPYRK